MRELALDFAPPRRIPPAPGLALLAIALVAATGLLVRYQSLALERDALQARLAADRPARATAAQGKPVDPRERARSLEVLRRLEAPWEALFGALEAAVDENVALLSVQPDAVGGRVQLTGEARTYDEALWFSQRLSSSGALAESYLTTHEQRREGAQRPVRFGISARWPAMERAAPAAGGTS